MGRKQPANISRYHTLLHMSERKIFTSAEIFKTISLSSELNLESGGGTLDMMTFMGGQ